MQGHTLFGLVELVFVVGLIAWLWYSPVGRPAKDKPERAAAKQPTGTHDEPPRTG